MQHSIGYPDLYHYSHDGLHPVGRWDLMESDLNPPQHSGAYMKYRYGTWISNIPDITTSGTYTLSPLTSSTNNAYKINSALSTTEYFVVEYRRRNTIFENSLPGSGLLVYRINTNEDGKGNRNGPPDEVYVFRPEGSTTEDGNIWTANLSSDVGRTSIGSSENPMFFSDGTSREIVISNISGSGDNISFDVSFGTADLSISKTAQPNPVYLGDILKYQLTVENNGPDSAQHVVVTDELPINVELISATSTKGFCIPEFNKINCYIGDMYIGEIVTIDIEVKVKELGVITNTANVTSKIFDPDLSNNTSETKTVAITKLSTGPAIIKCDDYELLILLQNTTSEDVYIDVYINNLCKCPMTQKIKTVKIKANCTAEVICKIPRQYEIVFDNVEQGIYIGISTIDYCCKCFYNVIQSNTFKHCELININ